MFNLTLEDQQMRKAILDCDGKLKIAAEKLDWPEHKIWNKLRTIRHKGWWRLQKQKYKRLRNAARQRRWYHNAKKRATLRDESVSFGSESV